MKRLAILFAIVIGVSCGGGGDFKVPDNVRYAAEVGGSMPTSSESQQRTPAGARVESKRPLSNEQLTTIDNGLAGTFVDARTSGYSVKLAASQYLISTPPYECQPSPEQRVPSFLVRADVYDATEFDQYNSRGPRVADGIGVVYAAEMVLSLGTPGSTIQDGWMYVCPQLSHLADAVRHGAEHIIIANNDSPYFDLTWYHGNGFYHPLLPKREQRDGVAPYSEFAIRSAILPVK